MNNGDRESTMRADWTQRQSQHGNGPRAVLMKGLHPLMNATIDRWHKQVITMAFAAAGRHDPSGPTLDVGCGYGRLALHARSQGLAPLVGMDFTPGFCAGFLANHGPAVCASLSQPPFRTASLSAAYSVTALMYLAPTAARAALLALDTCLAPGAPILILEPAKEFNDLARRLVPRKRSEQLAVDGLSRAELMGEVIPAHWRFVAGGANPWMTLALPVLALSTRVPKLYRWIQAAVLRLDGRMRRTPHLPYLAMYRWAIYRKP